MELLLTNSELLDLGKNLRGVCIACLDGRCWLTQSGDNRDHILGRGDCFTVRSNGRLIITAAKSCRLMLEQAVNLDRDTNLCRTINGVLRERVSTI